MNAFWHVSNIVWVVVLYYEYEYSVYIQFNIFLLVNHGHFNYEPTWIWIDF